MKLMEFAYISYFEYYPSYAEMPEFVNLSRGNPINAKKNWHYSDTLPAIYDW